MFKGSKNVQYLKIILLECFQFSAISGIQTNPKNIHVLVLAYVHRSKIIFSHISFSILYPTNKNLPHLYLTNSILIVDQWYIDEEKQRTMIETLLNFSIIYTKVMSLLSLLKNQITYIIRHMWRTYQHILNCIQRSHAGWLDRAKVRLAWQCMKKRHTI